MAKKKAQRAPRLCTFCGKPAMPVTWDDPFPRALWAGPSNDRPLKVPSCAACNNHSNESILKHFFIVFDSRFYPDTIGHFKTSGGKGDFRTFRRMWAEIGGNPHIYLDEQVTGKFVKLFMGIRRHLMGDSWYFVSAEQFLLFQIDERDNYYEARLLPLRVGGPNRAHPLEPKFADALNEPMPYKFRDFSYGCFADDPEGMVIGLRYERVDAACLSNRLYLQCFIPRT